MSHGKGEYSYYDYRAKETFHVNTIEGFWRLFKASVRSTHLDALDWADTVCLSLTNEIG